ncbi:MAG: hypothetical protein IPK17_05085 [Chloroflexi bacterium]|uniref:hypothetical protein n=1 Tax=Candidatus Flexifilum breve TaxID=3140694 RepID=UPI0031358C82|nr:hypothetical protein [Chloroflexota bacterium]
MCPRSPVEHRLPQPRPTTDVRLLRRIARDAARRGYSATDTDSALGERAPGREENIFPFQENADVMFNSALAHETGRAAPTRRTAAAASRTGDARAH